MNTVIINGVVVTKTSSGSFKVTARSGRVIVDGKDVTPNNATEINIVVNGPVEKLEADVCNKVSVTGDVRNVRTKSGDVEVTGNVSGSVQTMSGDVDCGDIAGSVSTMSGDVKHRRT
jgi:hypothetical protein